MVGDTLDEQYNLALLLLLAVAVNVPLMLCAKPMMFAMTSKRQLYDERTGHIELVSPGRVHDDALSEQESEEIKELEHKVDVYHH